MSALWHRPAMLANCLHDLTALGPGGVAALVGAMVIAGLAGGLTHCAGMCGPFVIAQVAAGFSAGPALTRLSGAALLPYQAGRATGYAALGALAGGAAGLVSSASSRGLLALPLAVAAVCMLAQGAARLPFALPLRMPHVSLPFLDVAGRLLRGPPSAATRFLLGLALSAMPCGLLYGALAAAMASGSALAGGLAMLGFALGTMPALIAVGLLGNLLRRRIGPALRTVSAVALLLNGAVLAALAWRAAGAA